ncbi:glycosyltransferase family 4 protein [Haladaptatus sp. DJG-WS-42]|uniref:glycosyltransferase family 4 protein n=1 Tax=Haladaptatus sp. DJG-WS-42 TaxID=3120516 RepID=UPI0030D5A453
MNIGIYNPRAGFATSGGTETFIRELLKRTSQRHTVQLITGAGPLSEELQQLDIEIIQIPFVKKEDTLNRYLSTYTPLLPAEVESLTMFWSIKRRGLLDSLSQKVDVFSTHYYLDDLLISNSSPLPSVFRFPGVKSKSIRWKLLVNHSKSRFVANSSSTERRIKKWFNIEVDDVVYAGVDCNLFSPTVPPAFSTDHQSILYVGRLDEGKGLFELLAAHANLEPIPELYIIGGGRLEKSLKEKSKSLETQDNVKFIGEINHENLPGYYTAADIFCLPSHHESLGLVNLESMACGTPVVSTQIDAIEEYLTNGENGFLIEPGNTEELTTTLQRLISNPSERESIGLAGRETAKRFDWSKQTSRMITNYERAICFNNRPNAQ